VTSYQLYRDAPGFGERALGLRLCSVLFEAGDSSGIYTLAYAGVSEKREERREGQRETRARGGDHGFGDFALPQQRQDLPLLRGGRERCPLAPASEA